MSKNPIAQRILADGTGIEREAEGKNHGERVAKMVREMPLRSEDRIIYVRNLFNRAQKGTTIDREEFKEFVRRTNSYVEAMTCLKRA